jgi:YD repeat-containing protein
VDTSTCKDPTLIALTDATIKWQLYIDSLRNAFDVAWYAKCTNAKKLESFTVSYQKAEHHYTLYYYDQAGQLVRTVPPEGVDDRRSDATFLANVKTARTQWATGNGQIVIPTHTLSTEYRYNTLGQVVQQQSPDGGLSKFWYDALGRLVVSQNAQQAIDGKYSYTLYDALGRISEVGQKAGSTMTQTTSRSKSALQTWVNSHVHEQVTKTVYDEAYGGTEFSYLLTQRNLRNRVSYTQVWNLYSPPSGGAGGGQAYANAATYYTYDIHGNVDTLLQDYGHSSLGSAMSLGSNRFKRMVYDYDLISGKVNRVSYQPGYISPITGLWTNNADRFYHRYSYDAENKLTKVETSHDSLWWEQDATYSYYKHGPLARVVLGQQAVQGVDYAYNLQGWLKGVNSTAVGDGVHDIGGDGKIGGTNALVARDVFGMALNYYQTTVNGVAVSDYKSINNAVTPFVTINNANTTTGKQLFNGNISSVVINLPKLGDAKLYQYGYDQLNRLMAVDVFEGLNNSNNTFTAIAINDYKERLTYSANGNIKTYQRNGTGGTMNLNNYTYNYTAGTNRIVSISNSVNAQTKNYSYDATGNTTADGMQGATNIVWNVYGKVQSLTNAQAQQVSYTYDAGGNRISKTVAGVAEWYVKDATGNTIATYTKSNAINSNHLTVTEWYKYGSSLLSINTRQVDVEQAIVSDTTGVRRGYDGYIITDHLGNTRAVVSDRKLQHTTNNTTVDYYLADVKTANYYSAYGATAKNYNQQQPIVAFNGQRKSNEIGADAQTALYWEYNGDVARRWNVDPKPNVSISSYNCFAGNPVWSSDPLGDTLKINATNSNTEADLRSIIRTGNQKYFSISSGGDVSFDKKSFDKLSRGEQARLIDDNGFALVKDLVESTKNFWFSTTNRIRYEQTDILGNSIPDPTTGASQTFIDNRLDRFVAVGTQMGNTPIPGVSGIPLYVTFTNLANTARGDEVQVGYGQKPSKVFTVATATGTYQKKFDGELYMAPGQYFYTNPFTGTVINIPRPSIVYHEMMENFLRANGSPYQQAHEASKKSEGGQYGNRQHPGEVSYFILGIDR